MRAGVLVAAAALAAACAAPPPGESDGLFADAGPDVGLEFVHWNGMTGDFLFPEIFGAGAALFDYDRDGDLDVYLVQGGMLDASRAPGEALFPPPDGPLRDRLFRNDLIPEGRLRFTDVTAESGIDGAEYGMGVAVGDVDGDGLPDLYVTNFGPNRLWRNLGDGRFEDVTAPSGTAEPRWSTSAAFLDHDGDGDLDLYVGNYVAFSSADRQPCVTATGAPDYCGPASYRSETDRLFRNEGGGRFVDATAAAGLAASPGAALGAIASDLDGDGRTDLYVANDGEANRLWINRGDGSFRDDALLAGCAFNADGEAEASMGVDAADYDGDGDDDLFMTHLEDETNTLYRNDGRGWFVDATVESGLGPASRGRTGFGTAWLDVDGDGRLDLIVANGAVKTLERLVARGDTFPLAQPNQLFRNLGDGRFEEISAAGGAPFAREEVSRALAVGDVDNDGDADVLVTNNNGPARLLLRRGAPADWAGVRLVAGEHGLDVPGASAALAGGRFRRTVRIAASYLSSNDPRLLLAPLDGAREVEVRWPGGTVETFALSGVGAHVELRRGRGRSGG